MKIHTELICRRKSIAENLGRVAAFCRYRHRGSPKYTLVAAVMRIDDSEIALEPSIAETVCDFDTRPVLQTASQALSLLGYETIPVTWPRMAAGILVFEAPLSAHDRVRAVDHFLSLGLPGH